MSKSHQGSLSPRLLRWQDRQHSKDDGGQFALRLKHFPNVCCQLHPASKLKNRDPFANAQSVTIIRHSILLPEEVPDLGVQFQAMAATCHFNEVHIPSEGGSAGPDLRARSGRRDIELIVCRNAPVLKKCDRVRKKGLSL